MAEEKSVDLNLDVQNMDKKNPDNTVVLPVKLNNDGMLNILKILCVLLATVIGIGGVFTYQLYNRLQLFNTHGKLVLKELVIKDETSPYLIDMVAEGDKVSIEMQSEREASPSLVLKVENDKSTIQLFGQGRRRGYDLAVTADKNGHYFIIDSMGKEHDISLMVGPRIGSMPVGEKP